MTGDLGVQWRGNVFEIADGPCGLHPKARVGRADTIYAGVMWRLIAYSSSSAFVLTFNVSIIRYL